MTSISKLLIKRIKQLILYCAFILPHKALASSPTLFGGIEGTELNDVGKLIKNATDILLLLGGIAFFAMLLWGSITIGTAAGNEERLANGKKTLTAAIVGLLIVVGAKIIVEYAIKFFGGTIYGG